MATNTTFDPLADYNRQRWNELAQAGIEFSRPLLDLDPAAARHFLDPFGVMGDVSGKRVLCLASGGGQQSIAFTVLGAHATVFDLSDTMLERDRESAAHYQFDIAIEQGDMRDLSRFDNDSFDIVYHAYSINFVPDVRPVLQEVARILRPHGLYRIEWHNPYTQSVEETTWNGRGYLLEYTYQDGREVSDLYPHWEITGVDNTVHRVRSPKSFIHGLGKMINTLATLGFAILHCSEYTGAGADMTPGSWDHYNAVTAPWITLWSIYRPDVLPLQPA
jgi:ubiquinone/menaquinone biosynthesis C-methylase UbiE